MQWENICKKHLNNGQCIVFLEIDSTAASGWSQCERN